MSLLSNAWGWFIGKLAGISHAVLAFALPALESLEANGGEVLADAAMAAVLAAETSGGSGSQKAASAFSAVVSTLKAKGIPVVVSAVNLAVETAVQNLKAQSTAKPDVPAPVASALPANVVPVDAGPTVDHPGEGGEAVAS